MKTVLVPLNTLSFPQENVRLISGGQSELTAAILAKEIVIEEVYIKGCLQYPARINHPIVLVIGFMVRPVDPVHDVQGAVCT